MTLKKLLALAASAVLVLCVSAGAQEPGPPLDAIFGEEIDVRVVNVEVVVEDRAGNRVHGLEADDFRIFVDGFPVEVDYFTEILENRAIEASGREAPPGVGEGDGVPTNYVVFVDDDHTLVQFRRPVLRGLADQLDELGARDQVAVVVQSGSRLQMLSPFTADRERTRDALRQLDTGKGFRGQLGSPSLPARQAAMARRGPGAAGSDVRVGLVQGDDVGGPFPSLSTGSGLSTALNDLPGAATARLPGLRIPSLGAEAEVDRNLRELEFSVTAVSSTMQALDVPEGRKALLLLAGDWPRGNFPAQGLNIGMRSDREVLDRLIDTANLLGYTIYPIDEQSNEPSMARWGNFRYMARDTGGEAFLAGSNLEALRNASRDTANYYWLGFVPHYRRDDRAHDVQVQVQRSDLRVRSRRGYLDLSRRAEADMETQGRLLFPGGELTQGEPVLQVEIGAAKRTGVRKMRVPVTVYIPIGHFPLVPYQDQFFARLELRFAVVDRNGQQAPIPLIPINLRGRNRPAPDAVMPYNATLTLRRKPHDLVVAIHDPVSDQTISARTRVSFR
ncbi:MAG: VWA domain-containing protein [Acidobacteria bacterium]|nr:VWA domain-containing protein [Acidobacteriota bacterium]